MKNLSKEGTPNAKVFVHTWELYDKSFTFPRVRRYDFVQENMDIEKIKEQGLTTVVGILCWQC